MSQELSAVNKWIVQSLALDPDLDGISVWADVVPEGEAFPCIVFSALTSRDRVGSGAVRLLTRPLYIVRAIGTGSSFAPLAPLASAIDRRLQAGSLSAAVTIDGAVIRGSFREEPLQSTKVEDGITYRYLGGLYRVFVYPAEDDSLGDSTIQVPEAPTQAALLQQQITALQQALGDLTMSVHALAGAKYAVGTPITATATVAMPTNSTTYGIDTTSGPVTITLPIAVGGNIDLEFIRTAGTNPVTFALNAADSSPGALANTALANIGDVQAFRDIASHIWEAH